MGQGFWGVFPPAAPAIPAAVENSMGAFPRRHWLDLPRGRGPSQTPKFLSPGPPSPWLPALPPVDKQNSLVVQVPPGFKPGDARGEAPCIRKLKSPPSPPGKGVGGIGGKNKAKGRVSRQPTGCAPPLLPLPPKNRPPSPREVGILFKECTVNMVKAPKLDAVMENGKNTC